MSKELEELAIIKSFVDENQSQYDYGASESVEKLMELLTPPTAEQLCKELSEYLKEEVKYDDTNKRFYIKSVVRESFITLIYNTSIQLNYLLSGDLLIMISKFYKGVLENGN